MRSNIKVILTALAATVTMAFIVGNASANTLRTSSLDAYIIWEELTFIIPIGGNVICPVTLLGSFHRETFSKEASALIGMITHATATSCSEGDVVVQQPSLPWPVTFDGYMGSLPNLRDFIIDVIGAEFVIDNGTASCFAGTEVGEPAVGSNTLADGTGRITNLRASGSIDLISGDAICDFLQPNGELEGDAVVEDDTSIDGTGVAITLV